ncbi:2Fe-2S iron-sulfur cluster-binding protein [Algiphilus sp.]|uniref:2Fe-2S iron-sulfur cluster-binding protein n=1 Tax=Algiphilus sp. TaxID=1872431 RepID=UPI0025BC781A|nr:2Fe-2S iron-sulfur cluster-binding protein [Algiphilus sp.]MCK5769730.1 2Fe-2S iron-sulfur cluster binding domain-containing protein [Algiphilus sp.]
MARVEVVTRDGESRTLESTGACPLMEVLRDGSTGVEGTCGGMCSCGTCHVYVAPEWAGKLPERSEDEAMMLEALGDFVEVRPTSRLACQIELDDGLSGIAVEVAPEA